MKKCKILKVELERKSIVHRPQVAPPLSIYNLPKMVMCLRDRMQDETNFIPFCSCIQLTTSGEAKKILQIFFQSILQKVEKFRENFEIVKEIFVHT